MHQHRARLIAIALLASLALALLVQILASADSSVGGGFGNDADDEHGFYAIAPELEPGDHFRLNWETVFIGFRPVFAGGDFYVVEGSAEFPFNAADHKVLYHGRDTDPGTCCGPNSVLEMGREPGQDKLTLVWVLDYGQGWAPVGAQATGLTPLMGGTDTAAQEREIRYIQAFVGAGGEDGSHGPFENLQIVHGPTLAKQPWFVVVEGLLALGALGFWAFSLGRSKALAADGEAARLVALVERGRDHLRAQLRLHLLVGPLLFIAAIFGVEAIDNGGFSFYDPSGFYPNWIVGVLLALWLTAFVIWVVGLTRVSRSLRHFNRTQEPDLGA